METFKFDHSFVFSCFHLLFSQNISLNYNNNNILCHEHLSFFTRAPFFPLPLQNPLGHVNGKCRLENMSFGEFKLHGHSNIFSLV